MADLQDVRRRSLDTLSALGFQVARSLPLSDPNAALRPLPEIAARLMALDALFSFVALSEAQASTDRLRAYADHNDLRAHLTPDERALFDSPRDEAHAGHVDSIGWRLENMWALAWVLGFEPAPDLEPRQLPDEVIQGIVFDFLPGLDATLTEWLPTLTPRGRGEVVALEDLFYCAHNAVRSAQLGGRTVPPGFHPILHGGAVHERRHALTWSLSPGVAWNETDLST